MSLRFFVVNGPIQSSENSQVLQTLYVQYTRISGAVGPIALTTRQTVPKSVSLGRTLCSTHQRGHLARATYLYYYYYYF